VILFGVGADYVAIARAFMMSAGCIRARESAQAHMANIVQLALQHKTKKEEPHF